MSDITLELEPNPEAPGRAREALRALRELLPEPSFGDLLLMVSELVTNSVRHGRPRPDGRIEVRARPDGSAVRVEVSDAGSGFDPDIPPPTIYAESGWGLFLVSQLADRWGVERNGGTTVWFEITRS